MTLRDILECSIPDTPGYRAPQAAKPLDDEDAAFVAAAAKRDRARAVKNAERDRERRNAGRVLTTHCPSGHEYTEENSRWTSTGSRKCRACDSARRADRKRRARAR